MSAVIMGILNLTPDSFWESSRYNMSILESDADIIDIGAVSSRPGASYVGPEEEWARLEPFLKTLKTDREISIDTTRAEIVRRACDLIGPFIVNDISAGEDDPDMLMEVGRLELKYIAMHRHSIRNAEGVPDIDILTDFFGTFGEKAGMAGIREWIIDPGFGFNKDVEENILILKNLEQLTPFGRRILAGVADKRFTRSDEFQTQEYIRLGLDGTEAAHLEALRHGAGILRVHDVKKARRTVGLYEKLFVEQARDLV